jgi:hypothetical protein
MILKVVACILAVYGLAIIYYAWTKVIGWYVLHPNCDSSRVIECECMVETRRKMLEERRAQHLAEPSLDGF